MPSIPLPGWNGANNPGTKGGSQSTNGSSTPGTSGQGGVYVWSDSTLKVGLIDTGIHTRVLKDIAVVGISVALLITGLVLIAKPDLTQLAKSATAILPEVA